jgi:hypothetical protein
MSHRKGQILCFSAAVLFLLFFGLGHNSLWDDEANTALFGKSVWQTGDTNALLGDNLIAFRGGLELKDLKNRLIPPLQYYFISPVAGNSGSISLLGRAPFVENAIKHASRELILSPNLKQIPHAHVGRESCCQN